MTNLLISLTIGLLYISCAQTSKVGPAIPEGWKRVEGGKFMTFYLPNDMRLESAEMCVECAWGSTYSNDRMRLHATYTSWNEEYAQHYLAKQAEYVKEMTTIDGNIAKIQSWRLEQVVDGYTRTIEARVYDSSGGLKAMMYAWCNEGSDLEKAKKIFMTIHFH